MFGIIDWFKDLLFIGGKDDTLIGLTRLNKDKPVIQVKEVKKTSSNLKISDLMRGESY